MTAMSKLIRLLVQLFVILSASCSFGDGRRLNESSWLRCRVLQEDTQNIDSTTSECYVCIPIIDYKETSQVYELTLPHAFIKRYGSLLLTHHISIQDATIQNGNVVYPEGARIKVERTTRNLPAPVEQRRLVVIRVKTLDGKEPTLQVNQLIREIFGEDKLTLASQYKACSHGKLRFVPNLQKAPFGVIEVTVNRTIVNATRQDLTSMAIIEAQKAIGVEDLSTEFENVIINHPPGSMGNWAAYGFLNYHISVYNDLWVSYISAVMHEVGHNLGLYHSHERGQYRDQTGYMGFSYKRAGWPQLCFNSHKNWQLGWFKDRRTEIFPLDYQTKAWVGTLAAFTDYDLTKEDEYVGIKLDLPRPLYLQYNRATKMNIETREKQDQLIVVQDRGEHSELLAGINITSDGSTRDSFVFNVGASKPLIIKVCSQNEGDMFSPDHMIISIGVGVKSCPDRGDRCDDDPTKTFGSVTTGATLNCNWLSRNPSQRDTYCRSPSRVREWCPESCGVCKDDCEDDATAQFNVKGVSTTCSKLADQPELWEEVCVAGSDAFKSCGETCNSCAPYNPKCNDDTDRKFLVNATLGSQSCLWLADKGRVEWRRQLCVPSHPAFNVCEETCGKCYDNCEDDNSKKFEFQNGRRRCSWLALRHWWKPTACAIDSISQLCPETCSTCPDI